MDTQSAREIILKYNTETFGRLTELRDVAIERSSAGRIWIGNIYCVTEQGDVHVGRVGVSENGQVVRELPPDALIEALLAIKQDAPLQELDPSIEQDFSSLGQEIISDTNQEADGIDLFFSEFNSSELMGNIIGLLASGDRDDLLKARRLMPQLLVDHKTRGTVLRYMGELEIRLGEILLGIEYLEAAAAEFADQGDVESLRRTASVASRAAGTTEGADASPIERLLQQTLNRLVPLESVLDAPAFSDLDEVSKRRMVDLAVQVEFAAGEVILEEGAPAVQAFVIQSGILGISLETPGGERRTVRCCFPGELVGESCVQGEGATCNATVFAQKPCTLWRFDGKDLNAAAADIQDLKARLDASRTIHRLDSFFSMNNATSTLDVRIRDRLLGCINTIRYVREREILERRGELPGNVYLVLSGRLESHLPDGTNRPIEPDEFACLRDTLHKLALEGDIVVGRAGRVIAFDPDALYRLALSAPPEVTAVLERLE